MRKQTIIQLTLVLAVLMFFAGYFDTEVTAFLTTKVKYGISMFTMVILYAYILFLEKENQSKCRSMDNYEERESKHWEETRRLHETILKLKSNGKKSGATRKRSK